MFINGGEKNDFTGNNQKIIFKKPQVNINARKKIKS